MEEREKVKDSQGIISGIAELIYEIRHDRQLSPIPDDGSFPNDVKTYNDELALMTADNKGNWFTVSWLYGECYMYRRLRTLFALSTHWKSFDPFAFQKINAFRSSESSILLLAESFDVLLSSRSGEGVEMARLEREFREMMEICLWGNATDLSLLTSLTHEQIQELQSVERGSHFILKDDLASVWNSVKELKGGRIDFVLDNSGFELFTDLVLADWFLTLTPFCTEVVFHPKLIPWFVSDVLPTDFNILITSLLSPTFFPTPTPTELANLTPAESAQRSSAQAALKKMVERWSSYIADGRFRMSVDSRVGVDGTLSGPEGEEMSEEVKKGVEMAKFWTSPFPYGDLPQFAPELLQELKKSDLTIWKGDLNYRRLVGDAKHPTTTPFEDTLGPLRGEIEILSLRTCKADVCVGLKEGMEERLDAEDKNWRVGGKYAVISYSARDV